MKFVEADFIKEKEKVNSMLTPRQQEVLTYIKEYIQKHQYGPTLDEIGKDLKMGSASAAYQHVKIIQQKGYLKKLPHQSRGIGLFNEEDNVVEIPLLGSIALGEPIQSFDEPTTINIPPMLLGGRGNHYALRALGNSMNAMGILNGDILVIEQTNFVDNGQVAVVLTEDEGATLKRVFNYGNQIELRPESNDENYQPMFYDAGSVQVQGKFCGLIRKGGY